MSTAKAELHDLIENLSEYQASKLKKVVTLFVVEFMPADQGDEIIFEPLEANELTDEDRAAIQQAKSEIANGETIPADQVFKELGI